AGAAVSADGTVSTAVGVGGTTVTAKSAWSVGLSVPQAANNINNSSTKKLRNLTRDVFISHSLAERYRSERAVWYKKSHDLATMAFYQFQALCALRQAQDT
ncbi:MAG: hypothetical protein ACPG8W_22450, partial [Candidatus Promineifilaceae bacterium]